MTVTIVAVVLAVLLAGLSTQGILYALATVVLAAYLAFVVTFGARRTGIACMMAAFASAPMYRGIEQMTGGVPPTDVFLVIGIAHLLPSFIQNRLKVPTLYLSALMLMSISSLLAVVVIWAALRNRSSKARRDETEAATRELYNEEDRAHRHEDEDVP